jgi:hypothetical protein
MKKIITVDNNMLNVDLVVFHDVLVLQNILFRLQSLKSTDGMTIIKVKKKDFLLFYYGTTMMFQNPLNPT